MELEEQDVQEAEDSDTDWSETEQQAADQQAGQAARLGEENIDKDGEEEEIEPLCLVAEQVTVAPAPEEDPSSQQRPTARSILALFDYRFLTMLVLTRWLLEGLGIGLFKPALPYMLRAIGGVTASRLSVSHAMIFLPWSLKSLASIVMHLCPVGGYFVTPYMLITGLASAAAAATIAFGWPVSAELLTACGFLVSLNTMVCNLVMETKTALETQPYPEVTPVFLSYIYQGKFFFSILSAILSSAIYHEEASGEIGGYGPHYTLLVFLLLNLVTGVFLLRGYMRDKAPRNRAPTDCTRSMSKHWRVLCLSALVCVVAVGYVLLDLFKTSIAEEVAYLLLSTTALAVGFYFALPTPVFWVTVFLFSWSFFSPNIHECVSCPHFTPRFFVSFMGTLGAVFGCLGISIYRRYLTDWRYTTILTLTRGLEGVLGLLNIPLYLRWNQRAGISDSVFFFGDYVLFEVVDSFRYMTLFSLLNQLVPKDGDLLWLALYTGTSNLSLVISYLVGAWLLTAFHVEPSGKEGDGAQLDNLWLVALIVKSLPFLSIPLIWLVMPDVSQQTAVSFLLAQDDDVSEAEGDISVNGHSGTAHVRLEELQS